MEKLFCLFFCFFGCMHAGIKEYPLEDLKNVADGLNIEGGSVCNYLGEGQLWANLCVVLDRPFADGMEWQEITALNSFPLKETSILSYNEAQVNLAYGLVLKYYLTHAHTLVNKSSGSTVKILVQVHRNTSGPHHLALLKQLLDVLVPIKNDGIEVIMSYGTRPELLAAEGKYKDADIVLSFSLVAGFNPDWPSGSLLLPQQHIPFSLKTLTLEMERKYLSKNHLHKVIGDVLNQQDESLLNLINHNFQSINSEKQGLIAKTLTLENFKEATLLQVDGMFNPSQLPPTYKRNIQNRVALITGASQGIGYAIAQVLAEGEWSVWSGTREPKKLASVPSNIHPVFLDVRDDQSIRDVVNEIVQQEGRIDVLINNSAYVRVSLLENESIEEIKKLLDVNFLGVVRMVNAVLPIMRQNKSGHILNLSSSAGIQAVPCLGAFSASKFALEGYSEVLAAELSSFHIDVSILEIGNVNTCFLANASINTKVRIPKYKNWIDGMIHRLSSPRSSESCREVAEKVVSIIQRPGLGLRYYTSERIKNTARNRWVDPTGVRYLAQQKDFLYFLEKGEYAK